ncbi:MAG: alanine racemase [Gemmatimonadota bacterium]|jgi:D-serine deaminase-like pyridoxal phosphate-dependent protein
MAQVGSWRDLDTPAPLVDVDRMETNLRTAAAYCREHNLAYRPHAKTHKSSVLARKQLDVGAIGATVATPQEAQVMARVVDDILVAYPFMARGKLGAVLSLDERVRLSVALDSSPALEHLANAARERGREVGVLVEVDVGLKRVGVPCLDDTLKLAREAADTPGVHYDGILFYPGHIRMPSADQTQGIQALSAQLVQIMEALERIGLSPSVVSGGSTPTFFRSHEIAGTTEVRAGTGIFNDRTTALLDGCAWTDCAYSVLATVVSTAIPGQAVVDAGSKALSKEEVNGSLPDPSAAAGFGCVLDRPELRVTALSEEHGIIDVRGSDWRPRPGDLVRIVPNHVCVSVNLFARLWQVRGDDLLGSWAVEGRRG